MIRWLIACFLLSFAAAPAFAASVAQYDQALARVQSALTERIPILQAHEIPSGQPPEFIARRVLAPIQSVTLPDGTEQPVRNSFLITQLAAADRTGNVEQLLALQQQIQTLRAALDLSGKPAPPSSLAPSAAIGGVPVALAHRILAQPAFASTPYPPPPLSERIANWLNRELNKIHWPHAPNVNAPNINLPNISPAFIRGLLWMMLAIALGIVVFVLVQVLSRRQARLRTMPLADETEAALMEARDTESLMTLAERQAKAGDYRRAFRLVYVATLVALDTGGVLRFNRSRTNWEYLRALRAAGRDDVYRTLLPLTRQFDRVWYGFAPAGPTEYADAVAQYQALSQPTASTEPGMTTAHATQS